MKVYLGADHGGYRLKEELKEYLSGLGYEIEDMGAYELDPDDDYPDFIFPVATNVSQNQESMGIVIGLSGNGEAIAANKVNGIRAALCMNENMTKKAREDNDANVLALGADFIDQETAKQITRMFLETPFSGEERHKRRINKIQNYDQ